MAKRKVAQTEQGQATIEAVELARRGGNADVLRELDAYARPLLAKMREAPEDPNAFLRAMQRSDRVRWLVGFMERAPDKLAATLIAEDLLPSIIAPELSWPTTPRSERTTQSGRFPPLPRLTIDQRKIFKRVWLLKQSERREVGNALGADAEMKFLKELPPDATGADMVRAVCRNLGLPEKDLDQLFAFERAPSSTRRKAPKGRTS